MSLRFTMLGAGAIGGSVLDLTGDYRHGVVTFASSSSSMVDPDGLGSSTVHDHKEYEGVVGGVDPEAVFNADYDALVETMSTALGDVELDFSHVERALVDDRHMVFVNKDPVAKRYAGLCALEAESEGTVQFEAAVNGAIPILLTISSLDASHVTATHGVLNGTANFIPSRMTVEGLDHEHVLTRAQGLDVVKADPTFDVDSIDAALKFVILTGVLLDDETEYAFDSAVIEGICNVPGAALGLAAKDGRTVRLIGEATADGVRMAP